MLYNDKETKAFEEKFDTLLANTRLFLTEEKDRLEEKLTIIAEQTKIILEKPTKTKKEIALLKTVAESLKPAAQAIADMQLIMQESILRQSTAYYENVKKLAAEGNEKAIEIYKELRSVYEAMIKEQLSDN